MHLRSSKPVIRALNRQPLIFGIDWTIYLAVVVFCVLIVFLISKAVGWLLLLILSLAGRTISQKDIQLPRLWAMTLFQKGSYDPAKYEGLS